MLNYIPQSNFRRKDNLRSGDPDKMVTGAELAAEFAAVQRSINSAIPSGTYTITTDFRNKDALASGNPAKKVLGSELDTEFDAIATALSDLGGSYTPTYDGAALDAADTEITGDPIMDEFEAIAADIVTVKALQIAFIWYSAFYDSDSRTFFFGTSNSSTESASIVYTRNDGESFTYQNMGQIVDPFDTISGFSASTTALVAAVGTTETNSVLRAPKTFPPNWSLVSVSGVVNPRATAYDAVNGAFVVVGTNADATVPQIARSIDDGITWSTVDISSLVTGLDDCVDVVYGNGRLIALVAGTATTAVYISTDGGATWSRVTVVASNQTPRSIAYDSVSGLVVAVGLTNTKSMVSPDHGATWSSSTTQPAASIRLVQVIWNSDDDIFVRFGTDAGGTVREVMTSSDGETWSDANTLETSLAITNWSFPSLAYGPEGNLYLKGTTAGIYESISLGAATLKWPNQ